MPRVFIILLNWNSFADAKACILSLQKDTYADKEIVVVDNASTDDSPQRLQQLFPELTYIFNEENLGFAAGCNVGIRYAVEAGADYVLLLNIDTEAQAGFLEPAVAFAEAQAAVGLVGGKIYYHHDPQRLWDAGGDIQWLKGYGRRRGHGQLDQGQFERPSYTTFVTGCLMLIKREVLLQVGYLPEVYFFGVEEWDYSVQVGRYGYKLAYVPEFVIWHKVGATHNGLAPRWVYNYMRSRLLFMRRQAPRFWYPIWLLLMKLYGVYKKQIQFPRLDPENAKALQTAVDKAFADHEKRPSVTREDLAAFEP